jgi:hypothetical protein
VNYCELILNFKSIGERASTRAGDARRVAEGSMGARRFRAARRALIDKVKAGA